MPREQDDEAIARWLAEDWPRIKQKYVVTGSDEMFSIGVRWFFQGFLNHQ